MKKVFNRDWYNSATQQERGDFKGFLQNALDKATITKPVIVEFEKKDGSVRIMKSTTNPIIANIEQSNDEYCTVWDIEKNGYRKFNYENILSVDITE